MWQEPLYSGQNLFNKADNMFLVLSRPFILGENVPLYFPYRAACINAWVTQNK